MTSTKKLWSAGILAVSALFCLSLYQREENPSAASSTRFEDHSAGSPTQPSIDKIPASDVHDLVKFTEASDALPVAYRTLARSTVLPDGSVDSTGRTLPREFAVYLANENRGYDQFVAGLSAEEAAAFDTLKRSVGNLGAVRFIEFVAINGASENPSAFDFVNYSSLRELVREYPANNDAAKASITRGWGLLAKSSNPVFRLLAINEVHRVIKDKTAALALLDARTSEVDPVIVQALIDQLVVIGGDAAKGALKRVSENARERRDQAVSKAADDAIAKLK